jgi:MFS transporter, PAT family, beta-lactamase induction signal transducer AmpG
MMKRIYDEWIGVYLQKRLMIIALFGFSCGIPYFLTSSTLAIWLKELGYDYTTIGLFAIATIPNSLRFLWAPFIDRLPLPILTHLLGRRRAWMLFSQLGLAGTLAMFFFFGPSIELALLTTFFAATQETVMLTYQMETLPKSQYGPGDAIGVMGTRLGMLVGGAGAIYLADFISWEVIYVLLACSLSIGLVTTLYITEPNPIINKETLEQEKKIAEYLRSRPHLHPKASQLLSWLYAAVVCPFSNFMKQKGWLAALGIMFFYKFGDNLIGSMPNLMYIELGFSKPEIAEATKLFGMITSIIGGLFGGVLITRLGFLRGLLYFGALHMLATVMYIATFYAGHDLQTLYFAVALEHFTAGMRTAALFAFQLTLSNPIYAATQLAILTSLVNFGRTTFASVSGAAVEYFGWVHFYNLAILASIPALLICIYLMKLNEEPLFKRPALQIS